MAFYSPSKGELSFDAAFMDMIGYMNEDVEGSYKLIIGTDSHAYLNQNVTFVTAIIIHRIGKGGRYYFQKQKQQYMGSLRQRMYFEASLSLEVASRLTKKLSKSGFENLNVEIHLDIGEQGDTRDVIRELVGMVIGSGYNARIKPESYGASKVADKYTR